MVTAIQISEKIAKNLQWQIDEVFHDFNGFTHKLLIAVINSNSERIIMEDKVTWFPIREILIKNNLIYKVIHYG